MRLTRAVLTAALGMAIISGRAAGQGVQFVPAVSEGDTLKVWAVTPRLNGTVGVLAGFRADSLILGQYTASTAPSIIASVPYASLRRIDVRRGTHRSTGRIVVGTMLGAAAGGLLGAAIGPAIECRNDCSSSYGGIVGFVFGAGVGGIAGGITGGMIGARRVPKWESVRVGG